MKTLFLDCSMGAAGDMLCASLLELIDDADKCIEEINSLGIPGVEVSKEVSTKCGINGTHYCVKVNGVEEESFDDSNHEHHHDHEHDHCHEDHEHEEHEHVHCHEEHEHIHCHCHDEHDHEHHHDHDHHHHHHTSMADVENIVIGLSIPENVKKDVMAVYNLIAEAESKAHGMPVTQIHFHEVGTMDAVADVVSCCLLMNKINPDKVIATPVHVGSGHVHCAHGVLPVPAPATAHILKGVPIYGGSVKGELCTPTGAALLKHFVDSFEEMPLMTAEKIGYGMGKKDFEQANCVRAVLGTSEEKAPDVYELSCNVDDMTGEKIGYCMEKLFDAGALDVYTIPIGMKKSRPGILIHVMCSVEDKDKMVDILFKNTTTLGVRQSQLKRYCLKREIEEVETPYGVIRRKAASGYGVKRGKFEYEDLAKIAEKEGKSIFQIEEELKNL